MKILHNSFKNGDKHKPVQNIGIILSYKIEHL